MVVSVRLHTILGRSSPQGMLRDLEVELSPGSTLGELLRRLDIELSPDAMLLVVNGRLAGVDDILQPGDRVNLMPAISGGLRLGSGRAG